ncbi:hypothetical protein [uncultured Methanobrevibacter sp.]|uniref:hypothetical protein n=1 Tax=uncultured Methanobrevibacter sp. TaxID=253161 RepID=UPI00260174E2|nr:hypothetical protein [uncultured Methanobrevibacter sp.]
MSKKQNKQHKKRNMEREELNIMDKHLLEHVFPSEVEGLPLEELTEKEQTICNKCRNHEKLTHTEFKELKKLLGKYRSLINEYKPTEENYEKATRIIKSEKELLDLLDNQERYNLKMRYRVGSQDVILDLIVKPLTNSQAVTEMQNHLNLFREFTQQERLLSDKATRGETLSSEESKMLEHINKKAEDQIYNIPAREKDWDEFLARQVEFKECNINTFEEKVAFWKKIDVSYKVSLYNKVRDILNLTETEDDDLFLTD